MKPSYTYTIVFLIVYRPFRNGTFLARAISALNILAYAPYGTADILADRCFNKEVCAELDWSFFISSFNEFLTCQDLSLDFLVSV